MTFNDQYLNASIRHQVDLLRYGAGVARKVNGILDETLGDLRQQVQRRLGKASGIDSAGLRRLRELERAIEQTRSPAWNDVTELWTRSAVDVALEEPVFIAGTLTSVLPVELDLVSPSSATLRALATERSFNGRFLKDWSDSTARADLTRIKQQIRIGMVQGESSRDIASRVFGARGAAQVTRGQAEAVTRTMVSGVANAAQQQFLADNSDLFDSEQLVATLDSRTTPICRAEDGKQYPVGQGPIPPLHVACRSLRVAVIDGAVVGDRPFKAGTERQMLREFAEARGLDSVPNSRDDLPRGTKGDFDAFSRRRMRELTGQVPARTTYQEWLKGQPAEIQDDILGPTRGKLFRDGGLTLDRFVSRQGDELTLDELKERNRKEWERAGVGRNVSSKSSAPDAEKRRKDAEAEATAATAAAERKRAEEAASAAAEAERKAAEEKAKREAAEKEAALQRAEKEAAEKATREAEARAQGEERRRKEAERKASDEARRRAKDLKRAEDERKRVEREEALRKVEQARRERREKELAKKLERERFAREQSEKAEAVRRKKAEADAALNAVREPKVVEVGNPSVRDVETVKNALARMRPAGVADIDSVHVINAVQFETNSNFGKMNASGLYSPNTKSIYVATEQRPRGSPAQDWNYGYDHVAKSKEEAIELLVAHEYGHHVHLSGGDAVDQAVLAAYKKAAPEAAAVAHFNEVPTKDVDPDGSPSVYGTSNHAEFFAESFAAYHHNRVWLRDNKPVAYAMVEEVLGLLR